MNAIQIVEVETALGNLAADCRAFIPPGLPGIERLRAFGYLGGLKTGLDHLAAMLDELSAKLKSLRVTSSPQKKEAALGLLRQTRASVSTELELYLHRPDQWDAGQSSACRWCLPSLDDIIRSVERAE